MRQVHLGMLKLASDRQIVATLSRRQIAEHLQEQVQLLKYEAALREIIQTLGPDTICSCDHSEDCGLASEAHEALQVAKRALFVG